MDWIIQEAARRQTGGAAGTIADIASAIRTQADEAWAALFPPPAPTDVVGTRVEPSQVVELLANGTERVIWSAPEPEPTTEPQEYP